MDPAGATPSKPLELRTAARDTELCSYNVGRPDLAWYDLTVKVNGEADWVRLDLVNAEGVHIAGSPTVIPAVNFGGRIDTGGFALWSDRNTVANSNQVQWGQPRKPRVLVPTEGQTAMLMMRLRFTDGDASFDGVKATYRLPDGETGSTTVKMPVITKHSPACRD